MATQYWKAKWNMEEDIDLLDYCESLEDVTALSDEEASSMIDILAEKAEDEE